MHSVSPNKKHHDVWQWYVEEEAHTHMKTRKHGKMKVYCAKCLDIDVQALREGDEESENECTDEERYRECE